ncbi:hypothetical protein H7X46_08160 [Pseudonocardia sp. C8]|uniref:hypothetical protein n=1 Tax=Pseudonocardia sp. C8 TaxID=2762759 RepID=UPI0016435EF1|nr:hypothetical protein [Pseudonocardia sp. C8]MBC3191034.1 hypothetical protein [Pseudonocardia sp. C8]
MSSRDSYSSSAASRRVPWRPSASRLVVIAASVLAGVGLMLGAAPLDGWWQSVLVEVGASVLLLAPLAYIEDYLRRSLGELNATLQSSATGLSAVRRLVPSAQRRAAVFDALLAAVEAGANAGEFTATQISTLLDGGSEDRTVALAAMAGNASLADGAAIVRSIRSSASGNEQFYALRAADAGWAQLRTEHRTRILAAIDEDDRTRRWIADDPHRQRIAARLRAPPPPQPSEPRDGPAAPE